MSDSSTNVEIEDVLSSIRRLVSEDRAAAGSVKPADPVPPAPMLEAADQVESATVTHFLPRGGQANHRTAPGEALAGVDSFADTRIDAAIVSLNAETGRAVDPADSDAALEPAAGPSMEELVDTSELLAEPYQQAGAKGAQFVLTADFLVETSASPTLDDETTEGAAEELAAEPDQFPDEAEDAAAGLLPEVEPAPVQPPARPDLSLDDLVSGDALLATFGSVGASPAASSWDSDALADLAPRTAPRAYPLHPTLEATIADLEMAVAAQSEEFEPDLGEDIAEDLALEAAPVFEDLPRDIPADPSVQATEDDMSEWEAAEARVEAVQPLRRHRLHLNAAEASGYIGISDAFPAEDQDAAVLPVGPAVVDKDDASGTPEADQVWARAASFGADYSELSVENADLDLESATDETLLGIGDAIDAPRLPVEAEDLSDTDQDADARAGEAEGYPDPAVDPESGPDEPVAGTEPAVVASPARRIFIAPRADLSDAGSTVDDIAADADAWEPVTDMADALQEAASASVAETLADDLAQSVARGLEGRLEANTEPHTAAENLPLSADLWQVAPTAEVGDEDLAMEAAPLDREELRSLVLDLIRQELQGPLGERITRNVRKLVRREINRALESRDLD